MSESQLEVENSVLGKLKLTGPVVATFLLLIASVGALFGAYLVFDHEAKAHSRELLLAEAVNKMTEAQDRMVVAQRENNCLYAFRRQDTQTPESLINFCKQFSR